MHNAVAVRSSLDCPTTTREARHYALCLDLYSPCPFPFLYFPFAVLIYPILLDFRISLVALSQLISFSVLADYGSVNPFVPPLLPGSGIKITIEMILEVQKTDSFCQTVLASQSKRYDSAFFGGPNGLLRRLHPRKFDIEQVVLPDSLRPRVP